MMMVVIMVVVVRVIVTVVLVIVRVSIRHSFFRPWCERGESNPHELPHWNLNPARLPVPPLSQV